MERKLRRMLRKEARKCRISGICPSVKLYDLSGANVLKHFRRGKFVKTLRF